MNEETSTTGPVIHTSAVALVIVTITSDVMFVLLSTKYFTVTTFTFTSWKILKEKVNSIV